LFAGENPRRVEKIPAAAIGRCLMDMLNLQLGGAADIKASVMQSARLPEIEVLRAVAVSMVLVEHLPINLVFWQSYIGNKILLHSGLWDGVDLFFAISGFVIARSLLPRLVGVTDWVAFTRVAITFWIARAWRLLPSAWLWLTAPLILCLFFNDSSAYGTFQSNWEMFVAGMLDLANFHVALVIGHYRPGTAFAQWSLSLEEQFYLLLPFAAFFFRRYLVIPLCLVALAGFFVPNTSFIFMIRLWPVAFGVLLALWSPHQSYRECAPTGLAKSRIARIALLVVLLACLVSIGSLPLHIVNFYQGMVAVISVGLVWVASYDRGYLWQEGFPRRVMEVIAARSYSLYLVHIPVYFGAHEVWVRLHGMALPNRHQAVAMLGFAFLALVSVAEMNHRLLERPLREHGKRLAAKYQARMALEDAIQ
jgi:peptidoglycan/LPS O-acetylase OafA/YrhL